MFYFDKVFGFEILKSSYLPSINHFFTTKEFILKTKEENNYTVSINNRELLKYKFGLDKIITPSQRHTDNIKIASIEENNYENTDALILNDRRIGIFLNFADCTPIVFYDKDNNVAAISHAGWRGAVQRIAQKTVLKLKSEFNSKPENIIALIGPAICYSCFETSEEIAEKLAGTVDNGMNYIRKVNNKYYADLKNINKEQLIEVGVKDIDVAPHCTCCNNDKFYSYRLENKTTNRMSAFICLN